MQNSTQVPLPAASPLKCLHQPEQQRQQQQLARPAVPAEQLTRDCVKGVPAEHCCTQPAAVSNTQPSHRRRPSAARQDLLA